MQEYAEDHKEDTPEEEAASPNEHAAEQTNEESVAEEANPIKELKKEASNHKATHLRDNRLH